MDPSAKHVQVLLGGLPIADTRRAVRVLERSHPPSWYLPQADLAMERLRRSQVRGTICEFKGAATYWDVRPESGEWELAAAWSYEAPEAGYEAIRSHLAFYPGRLTCIVDDEQVRRQDGGFYGGWITADVVGPFKGSAGSAGW